MGKPEALLLAVAAILIALVLGVWGGPTTPKGDTKGLQGPATQGGPARSGLAQPASSEVRLPQSHSATAGGAVSGERVAAPLGVRWLQVVDLDGVPVTSYRGRMIWRSGAEDVKGSQAGRLDLSKMPETLAQVDAVLEGVEVPGLRMRLEARTFAPTVVPRSRWRRVGDTLEVPVDRCVGFTFEMVGTRGQSLADRELTYRFVRGRVRGGYLRESEGWARGAFEDGTHVLHIKGRVRAFVPQSLLPFDIEVSADGFQPTVVTLPALRPSPERTRFLGQLPLAPALPGISGAFELAPGVPLADAYLKAGPAGEQSRTKLRTGPRGDFLYEGTLEPSCEIAPAGTVLGATTTLPATFERGTFEVQTLNLARWEYRLVQPDGTPMSQATVRARARGGQLQDVEVTKGSFTLYTPPGVAHELFVGGASRRDGRAAEAYGQGEPAGTTRRVRLPVEARGKGRLHLQTSSSTRFEVELVSSAGLRVAERLNRLSWSQRLYGREVVEDNTFELVAGHWSLRLMPRSMTDATTPRPFTSTFEFEVRAGETTVLDIPVGAPAQVVLERGDDGGFPNLWCERLDTSTGMACDGFSERLPGSALAGSRGALWLAPGTYRLSKTRSDEQTAGRSQGAESLVFTLHSGEVRHLAFSD